MLKKLIVMFMILFSFANYVFAADVIHLKNNTKYEGKVVAIHPETVELYMGENSPKRFFSKREIKVIVYENGETEIFPEAEKKPEMNSDIKEIRKTVDKIEKDKMKKSGIIEGVAVCCIIYIIASLIVAGNQ